MALKLGTGLILKDLLCKEMASKKACGIPARIKVLFRPDPGSFEEIYFVFNVDSSITGIISPVTISVGKIFPYLH